MLQISCKSVQIFRNTGTIPCQMMAQVSKIIDQSHEDQAVIQLFWKKCFVPMIDKKFWPNFNHLNKEIVERKHGEPIKFLFLPKMGLLGIQASNEKNCWLWIMSNIWELFFHVFMDRNQIFFFLHCRVLTEKLLDTKVKKKIKKYGKYFFGVKNLFF